MILPDINLLVYVYNDQAPAHTVAREWWSESLSDKPVALPWIVMLGFLRLMTGRYVLDDPLPMEQAVSHIREWLERPQVRIVQPTSGHLRLVEELASAAGVAGSLTTDIHLAALAIEHGAELHSNDSDFGRFPGLRWKNPLKT